MKPITTEKRLFNHPHGYSSIEYNKPKLSFQYDLSVSYFLFKNIGFSVIGGLQNHRFLQDGKSYGSLSESRIQEYRFQKIGIGPVYHLSLNPKFDASIKYSISYLKHTNNGDTYFLPLNTNQFQHSLMLGFNYNVNSFLIIGTEFIAAIATENMV